MRSWLTDRRRLVLMGGAALVVAVALGVVWGVADAGRIEASEATTTSFAAEATTTTEQLVAASLPGSGSTTTTEPEPTTTTTRRTSGGGGGTEPTTPPPNQPPVIEDPGISSDGMELTISPVVSDPENDALEFFFELDGSRLITPKDSDSLTTTVERGSDYVVGVSVTVGVVDSAGHEVVESFDHELQAVTTVTLRDLRFEVGASSCFEEEAAQRFSANIQLDGVLEHASNESQELRADRSAVVLLDELSGQIIGEQPSQEVSLLATVNGDLDSYTGSHAGADEVFVTVFADNPCRGFLSYRIDMETR